MKRLKDRIAENLKDKKTPNPRNARLAILLTMKDEIHEAYDFGWSLNTIWTQLVSEKKLDCSYTTFLKTWKKIKSQSGDTIQAALKPIFKEIFTPEEAEGEKKPQETEEESGPKIVSAEPGKRFSYENMKR